MSDQRNEIDDFDPAEVLGGDRETAFPSIPVNVTDPVRVEHLPTRLGAAQSVSVPESPAIRILNEDPMRAKVTLWVEGVTLEVVYISTSQAGAETGAALVAGMPPVTLTCQSELWARCNAAPTRLSYVIEQWTG